LARLVTAIPGCVLRSGLSVLDERGGFTKVLPAAGGGGDQPEEVREVFWSFSHAGTVRGMHVQGPTNASHKTVFLTGGLVLDVVLDLRRGSPAFGTWEPFELSPGMTLEVPAGCAHGFQALADATMVYLCDALFDPTQDGGVRYDSIGVAWPMAVAHVSARDLALPAFADYRSEF
jgi:dTDP-4-dehydrorhamnose 3,5-epimerase